MGRFEPVVERHGYGLPPEGSRLGEHDIGPLLALACSEDVRDRQVAAKNLCTCHVQADDDRVWEQLLRLFDDPDSRVRRDALHALTDSTPSARVGKVVDALRRRYSDPDPSLRRRVRRTLAHYRRTGSLTDAAR